MGIKKDYLKIIDHGFVSADNSLRLIGVVD